MSKQLFNIFTPPSDLPLDIFSGLEAARTANGFAPLSEWRENLSLQNGESERGPENEG